jgi:hypothetical protein
VLSVPKNFALLPLASQVKKKARLKGAPVNCVPVAQSNGSGEHTRQLVIRERFD